MGHSKEGFPPMVGFIIVFQIRTRTASSYYVQQSLFQCHFWLKSQSISGFPNVCVTVFQIALPRRPISRLNLLVIESSVNSWVSGSIVVGTPVVTLDA